MTSPPSRSRFSSALCAGWTAGQRHSQRVVDYLTEENRFPKRHPRGKRPRLNDDEQQLLTRLGRPLRLALDRPPKTSPGRLVLDAPFCWHARVRRRHEPDDLLQNQDGHEGGLERELGLRGNSV